MSVFLASNIGGIKKVNGEKIPIKFFEENQFLKNLRNNIKHYNKFILIASNPNNYEQNDKYLQIEIEAFKLSDIKFKQYMVLDNRNKKDINNVLENSSLIFLSGGNTYQQNLFFNEIHLKDYFKNINTCIVGISAGAINCAQTVFNSHEEEIALNEPNILEGLNLTKLNVEPHFDLNNPNELQMKEILNESYNRVIYGVLDKTYILDNTVYGKCYRIQNGKIDLISNDNEKVTINMEE